MIIIEWNKTTQFNIFYREIKSAHLKSQFNVKILI